MKDRRWDTTSRPPRGSGSSASAINESAYSNEAEIEHGPGAPGGSNMSRPEYLERDERGVVQGPQFIEAVAPACSEAALISFAPELGDGARDGVVKASVQRAKVVRDDGLVSFHSQVGDGLTDVAIVVHDL